MSTDIERLDELDQTAAEARATASKAEQEAQTIRTSRFKMRGQRENEWDQNFTEQYARKQRNAGGELVEAQRDARREFIESFMAQDWVRALVKMRKARLLAASLSSEALAANQRIGGHERRFSPVEARDFDPLPLLLDAIEYEAAAGADDAIQELLNQRERYTAGEEVPEPLSEEPSDG